MLIRLHGRHRSTGELQPELGLGYRMVVRWKGRPDGQDASSCPHRLHASLKDWQEEPTGSCGRRCCCCSTTCGR